MNRITEITKREIYDLFREGLVEDDIFFMKEEYPYYGRLEEIDFLRRLYDLRNMESNDSRFNNAEGDIIQHTVNNFDFPYCWVFTDDRFELMNGEDDTYLKFICEVFHPLVRDERRAWKKFFNKVNELLRVDGYELYVTDYISGRGVYGYRLCGSDVVDMMSEDAIRDLLEEFKIGLISKATDGDMDEREYKRCRDIVLKVPILKMHVPEFIKNNRTAREFRIYMQGRERHYADRRDIIISQMNELIKLVEENVEEDPFTKLHEYKKLEQIGYGGYGVVYRYHNDCLDMDFAVKIYNPIFALPVEQIEGEKRFFREAKILFSLNCNHVVRIYDAGRLEGKPYIRMEFVDGYNLDVLRQREGNMTFFRSAHVILHILAGLKVAHEHDILHRDLKPSNVLYSLKERMFKIIDFGVSAFMDTENHAKLTKTGEQLAGGIYIDPLLQENPRLRDPRSDIYSVGAIWYYLLCGRAPSGSDMRGYLKEANEQLQAHEIDIVMKCLASNIENRYRTCEELQRLIKSKVRM